MPLNVIKVLLKKTPLHFQEFFQQFLSDLHGTKWYEALAVISGIVSVWYSRKENVLVYPTGLINTMLYVYLSIKGHLLGEASVNFYYTVMSIIGWYMWTKKDNRNEVILHVTFSSKKEWLYQLLFFACFYIVIFIALTYFKKVFFPGVIPWADAFASATAFTGMWLMTRKKVESWVWWLATNIASIPLYAVKHYAFTSVYYAVLFIMAIFGLITWIKKARQQKLQPV